MLFSNDTEEENQLVFDFPSVFYFWFYLPTLILAIFCSIFVLYYIVTHRTMRQILYNHIIIAIVFFALIYQTTTFPWMLHYYRIDGEWERSSFFCRLWAFLDWSLYTVNAMLFAWSTIERYILIFHDRWISSRNRRIFYHYLPMFGIILYVFSFYSIAYFFPPCHHFTPVINTLCMASCLKNDPRFISFEVVFNQIMPVFFILIFATLLVLRTVWQRCRFGRTIEWRRHRKMIIQSTSVSILYLTCVFPTAIVYLMIMCNIETWTLQFFKTFFELLCYLPALLLPMVIGLSLAEIRIKFFELFQWKCKRRIIPISNQIK